MDKETSDALAHAATYLATAALAGLAGCLKYLRQVRDQAVTWSWGQLCLQAATSVFAGKIAEWLFESWKSDPNLVLAAVALAGWGGAQAIELAGKKLGTADKDA